MIGERVLELSCDNNQSCTAINLSVCPARPYCTQCVERGTDREPGCMCPAALDHPIHLTEICAGMGCFSIAGCAVGIRPCFAMDNDEACVRAFNSNFPATCTQLCITDKAWWKNAGPCRIITAGFPCRPTAGPATNVA